MVRRLGLSDHAHDGLRPRIDSLLSAVQKELRVPAVRRRAEAKDRLRKRLEGQASLTAGHGVFAGTAVAPGMAVAPPGRTVTGGSAGATVLAGR